MLLICFLCGITGCKKQIQTFSSPQGKAFFEAIDQYSQKNEHNYVLLDLIEQGSLEELGNHLQMMHHKKKTIFIIDEDGQAVEQVASYLASIGYRKIRVYLGGYQALLSYNEQYFQVVTGLEDCDC